MRILHIINGLGMGGAEKLLVDLLPLIQRPGTHVKLLLIRHDPVDKERIASLEAKGITVDQLHASFYKLSTLKKIRFHCKQADIIHAHLFPTLYLVALANLFARKGKRFFYTEHSTWNTRRKYPLLKWAERWAYSKYDQVIAISDQVKATLGEWTGHPAGIVVINNGIRIDAFETAAGYARNTFFTNIAATDFISIAVARFEKAKDHHTILKAFLQLPSRFRLLLVGEGGLMEEYQSFVDKHQLSERVKFLGLRKDVPQLLKTVDLSIVSSNWEGFGLVAAEAMAAGIPVIGSDVPGLREIVNGGGVLFEKGNTDELVKAIEGLANDSVFYNKIKEQGIKKASVYNITVTADKYLELYTS